MWEAYRNFWDHFISGGEDSGIWRSMDGGDTWENISAPTKDLPKGTLGKIGVAMLLLFNPVGSVGNHRTST